MKYREFWIRTEPEFDHITKHEEDAGFNHIHVIDYAAYAYAVKMLEEMVYALEKLEAGYAGMFGSNTESPKDDAYRTSPRIISMALNKYRKFKEGK